MDIAIVTGAETPLGLSLIQRLVRQGFRVHGIGGNFSRVSFADPQFFAHPVDLCDLNAVREAAEQILQKEKSLDLLIHALDVTPGTAFEKLPVGNLEAVLKIGLTGPVLLTRLALPNLLRFRGQLINVIPANKSGAPPSAVNALIEGGLREMNRVLFDQARDAGLRVTNLVLRQNPAPDGLQVQSSEQTHIDLEDVARAIEHLLDPNFVNVPAEMVLHPRSSAHSREMLPEVPLPPDPYNEVVLPPKAYSPPEQPKIPTREKQKVERSIPYTDDEMEDKIAAAIEDFEAHPERYERSQDQQRPPKPQQGPRPDSKGDGGPNKRRSGRRRGGRNRNRDRDREKGEPKPQSQPAADQPKAPGGDRSEGKSPPENSDQNSEPKPSCRSGRGETKHRENKEKQAENKPKLEPKGSSKQPSDKKSAKKTPQKKPAKKTAKKAAKKKVPAKKAAKKVAVKKAAKKRVAKVVD
ncbi:MAG: SDR family NAD(P)-dependent oxidoreductase [Verrucomicrobia bacterium]|jgi:NAD(P)-dependent dehydrogenase (short-subunit alcohol dehydrogenase family)|nr:SDR family NAD(P)-dependent oxidoreductase [Verrucomicrobiota bacterium]